MLTSRQKTVVTLSLVTSFVVSAHYAIFMSFYPTVAKSKGNSSTQVGVYFGVGSLIGLLGSTFFGWLMKKGVAPRSLVIYGLSFSGLCLMVQCFYETMDEQNFFYANFFTRMIHSIGPIAATTAIYPIVAVELKEQRNTYIPLLESAYNVGSMLWPSVGAILYEHFGYNNPFLFIGGLSIFISVVLTRLLPLTEPADQSEKCEKIGFDKIDYTLTLILIDIAWCYTIIGFNDITLAVELTKFELSQTIIGFCFAISTICYVLGIIQWGWVCRRSGKGRLLAQGFGYLITTSGLFLSGPYLWLRVEPMLTVKLVGQGLIGFGLAGIFTNCMTSGMHHLTEVLNLPDDVATHGFFSSLIFFSLCSGYLVGHNGFAGVLLDYSSYEQVLGVILMMFAASWLVNICHNVIRTSSGRIEKDEKCCTEHL